MIITSPVSRFPGTVTLRDNITWPMYVAWRDAFDSAREFTIDTGTAGEFEITDSLKYQIAILPGVLPIVESHTLAGLPSVLTPDNFPARPPVSAFKLLAWLNNEIGQYLNAEDAIPNG